MQRRSPLRDIPSGVWALGFVSLLMDVSSEMIHALPPVYLVTVLGTSMVTVGVIEGIAEATASITRIFQRDQLKARRIDVETDWAMDSLARSQIRMDASLTKAR